MISGRLRNLALVLLTLTGLLLIGAGGISGAARYLAFANGSQVLGTTKATTDNQVLAWDSASSSWLPQTAAASGAIADPGGSNGDVLTRVSGAWSSDPPGATSGVQGYDVDLTTLTTDRLVGRDADGSGGPEALTVGGGVEFTGSGGIQRSALTGDVTASAGSGATTIATSAVTLAKMADMATASLLGRNTAGTGVPEVLSAGTTKSLLSLNNVENTALSTWAGSSNVTSVGDLTTWGQVWSFAAHSGTYTIVAADADIRLYGDTTSGGFTWTLPGLSTVRGSCFYAKNIGSANNLTIARAGADTMDGGTSGNIGPRGSKVWCAPSAGTDWYGY